MRQTEIELLEGKKTVVLWQTKAEAGDPAARESLKPIYAWCRDRGYTAVVFRSGDGDLTDATSALLVSNRRRLAELEAKDGGARA